MTKETKFQKDIKDIRTLTKINEDIAFKKGLLKGKQEILIELNKLMTDEFILSHKEAFNFTEKFTEYWVKYITKEEIKTPEFKEQFKKMLH